MFECLFGAAPYRSATLQQLMDKLQSHAPIEVRRVVRFRLPLKRQGETT